MTVERRLKKTHKTVVVALHTRGQELQREIADLNTALNEQVKEWALAYGLDADREYTVQGKDDGELYLVPAPRPATPAEGPETDLGIPAAELAEAAARQSAIEADPAPDALAIAEALDAQDAEDEAAGDA